MSKERSDAEISRALRSALRKRYAAPTWCLIEEVRDRTGFNSKTTADALAMATWESRGLELHGFELKASRGDWLREIKNPAKADPVAQYVDRWWLVAASEELVKDGELPPTWGLMVLDKRDGLRTITQAEKREAKPLSRGFLASMLRRAMGAAAERVHPDDLDAKIEEEVARREALEAMRAPHEERQRIAELERYRKVIDALGIHLDRYGLDHQVPNIKKAYDIVVSLEHHSWVREQLERELAGHERAIASVREALADLRAIQATMAERKAG